MHKINWLLVGILSFVIILILFGAVVLNGDLRFRDWGMMGPIGMRENWGYAYTPAPLGWVGNVFLLLIPAGLIMLAVFGVVWFVRRNAGHSQPPSSY